MVDPGIGFGKTLTHNLQVLEQIALFQGLGCPVLLGASRKSFIARLSQGEAAKERLPGSLAAILFALQRGVQILRVHDVPETVQAVAVWQAMTRAPSGFEAPDGSDPPFALCYKRHVLAQPRGLRLSIRCRACLARRIADVT